MGLGLEIITTADTTPDTNIPPPTKEPTAKNIPPLELPEADSEDMTSGAPFPRAKSVTPARDSENRRMVANFSNAGDKNPSAVEPNI